MKKMLLKVECYSGFKAHERPVRLTMTGCESRTYKVMETMDQWYGVYYQCFKVRADDVNIYILRHAQRKIVGRWIPSRRQTGSPIPEVKRQVNGRAALLPF